MNLPGQKSVIQPSAFKLKGRYQMITLKSLPFDIPRWLYMWLWRYGFLNHRIKRVSPMIENLIVLGENTGLNIILQQLLGITTYPMAIDSASIGTGSDAPADDDIDLQTPVVEDIVIAIGEMDGLDTAYMEFFISNDELPNGTYTEFALKCGAKLFARSIITPSLTKADNEDTLIPYSIIGSNV